MDTSKDLYSPAYGLVSLRLFSAHPSDNVQVLGHESGHGVFSPSPLLNDTVGFLCHSALLTPYFAWQSTHRRHHIYANNLAKDHNYVPPKKEEYAVSLGLSAETLNNITEMTEDAPILVLLRIILQQLFGWPFYLISNITASEGCLYRPKSEALLGNSHYLPSSTLFRPEEAHLILASDIGILAVIGALYMIGCQIGFPALALLYIQPYLWCNHWIVAITFLHHTHPKLPRYDAEAWTFLRGALATVDRNLGWSGKHLLHNIADYHVIHHLFS
jgi:fatty acid desaturase